MTSLFEQAILREFDEAMREHGEPERLRLRFYRYLQLALKAAGEAREPSGSQSA
jgi:hypothetical protein